MLKAMLVRCHEVGNQFAYTLYQSAIVAVTHLSLGDVQSAIQLHTCNHCNHFVSLCKVPKSPLCPRA